MLNCQNNAVLVPSYQADVVTGVELFMNVLVFPIWKIASLMQMTLPQSPLISASQQAAAVNAVFLTIGLAVYHLNNVHQNEDLHLDFKYMHAN